jgi:hypothetical protein
MKLGNNQDGTKIKTKGLEFGKLCLLKLNNEVGK